MCKSCRQQFGIGDKHGYKYSDGDNINLLEPILSGAESAPYGVAITPNGAYAYVTNAEQQFGFGDKHSYEHNNG